MTLDQIKRLLRMHGRIGYRNIMKFSQISLSKQLGELVIDCPTRDDAEVLLWEYGTDLHLIVKHFRLARAITICAGGKTVYSPHSLDFEFEDTRANSDRFLESF